ncbi:unnamed protein product [Rhizoctonia solani]|uniref:Ricin B lectin domain-containing protein n=1 Tax=Rhizoctonia solani TaxID=456999 RepID=A0A8H2WS79_9AGAM|nr:unnamed protein product [Rhizoctonia solani]
MSIQPGTYMIHPTGDEGQGLGIGPVPLIYPPPSVPARILPKSMMEPFTLKPQEGNTYQLAAPKDSWYVMPKDEYVFLIPRETSGAPQSWSVQSTGPGTYRVQLPNKDLVWTCFPEEFPQIQLKPANGSQEQSWKFVRIDRD